MIAAYSIAVSVGCLAVAVWAAVELIRNRPITNPLFYGVAGIEVLLVVLGLIAVGTMIAGDMPAELATFIGYLLTALILPPVGVVWAIMEKSRWGCGVIVIASLIIPVLILRMHQVWVTPGSVG